MKTVRLSESQFLIVEKMREAGKSWHDCEDKIGWVGLRRFRLAELYGEMERARKAKAEKEAAAKRIEAKEYEIPASATWNDLAAKFGTTGRGGRIDWEPESGRIIVPIDSKRDEGRKVHYHQNMPSAFTVRDFSWMRRHLPLVAERDAEILSLYFDGTKRPDLWEYSFRHFNCNMQMALSRAISRLYVACERRRAFEAIDEKKLAALTHNKRYALTEYLGKNRSAAEIDNELGMKAGYTVVRVWNTLRNLGIRTGIYTRVKGAKRNMAEYDWLSKKQKAKLSADVVELLDDYYVKQLPVETMAAKFGIEVNSLIIKVRRLMRTIRAGKPAFITEEKRKLAEFKKLAATGAFSMLSDRDKKYLDDFYVQGKLAKDMGVELGMLEMSVYNRIRLAMIELKKHAAVIAKQGR